MDNKPTDPGPKPTSSQPAAAPNDPNNPEPIIVDSSDTEETEEDKEIKKEGIRGIISTVAILIIAPLIALSLTAFVFQSYEVDGPSMETTLQNHDRLIVYKLPKTISRITHNQYVPHRADIVIFSRNDSLEFGTNKPRQLIKRVIALPGERLTIKDNKVTVYNSEHPEGFNPDAAPYGKVITETSGDIDLTIPQGYIFVCGDNRPNSLDSRAFGPVPLNDVVGKLALRVYPFNKGQAY
jgi:signal peptidase I